MTNQELAHKIYTAWQDKKDGVSWTEDPRYRELHTIARTQVRNIINNFIRQDYF